jgi:hypothetical protein
MNQAWKVVCPLLLLTTCVAGCGGSGAKVPELATVKGKVTVDGQPGANLEVTFEPQAKGIKKSDIQIGAGSTAQTDAQGNYELRYQGGSLKGAAIGTHLVRINTMAGGGPAGGETAAAASTPIPPQYNTESEKTVEVKAGQNTIDLEVQTQ